MPKFKDIIPSEGIPNTIQPVVINDVTIQVSEFIPLRDKLALISDIINNSGDDQGFYNSAKLQFYTDVKFVEYYTNFIFEDDDAMDIYDTLSMLGFFEKMYAIIRPSDRAFVVDNVNKTIDNIYKYRNSVYGILDALKTDYSDLDLDVEKLTQQIANGENVEFLKEVIDKMG